jgi:F-type H+-transporting ATPase subunit k
MVVYYQVAGKKVGSHVVSAYYPSTPGRQSLALAVSLFTTSSTLEMLPRKLTRFLPYQLSMAVLGTMFAGSYLAMGGGSKPKTAAGPPINASSKEEGDFIQYVLLYTRISPTMPTTSRFHFLILHDYGQ